MLIDQQRAGVHVLTSAGSGVAGAHRRAARVDTCAIAGPPRRWIAPSIPPSTASTCCSVMPPCTSTIRIPAPGLDGVSLNAVVQISKWASDSGENNLAATLRAGAIQLNGLARKLREDLQTYLQVEELNLPKEPTPGLMI